MILSFLGLLVFGFFFFNFIPAISIHLGSQVSLVSQWEENEIVIAIYSDGGSLFSNGFPKIKWVRNSC